MQFGKADSATSKPHLSDPFQFPPATRAVEPAEPGKVADGAADRDRLDILDLSNDLEIHYWEIVP